MKYFVFLSVFVIIASKLQINFKHVATATASVLSFRIRVTVLYIRMYKTCSSQSSVCGVLATQYYAEHYNLH